MPAITNTFLDNAITSAEAAQETAVLDLFLAPSPAAKNQAIADYFKASGRELALEDVKAELALP